MTIAVRVWRSGMYTTSGEGAGAAYARGAWHWTITAVFFVMIRSLAH